MDNGQGTVLIVDDAPEYIDLLDHALRDDFRILATTNGGQCADIARQQSPDLILLDLIMPQTSGQEVLRQLKAIPETADIPVIIVTARGEDELEEEGFALGAVDYIVKPFSFSTVRSRVRTHVRLRKNEQKLAHFNKHLQTEVARAIAERDELAKARELQQQTLIQQSKMADLGAMLGAIAHQWAQPLNVIGLMAQELMLLQDEKDINRESIGKISSALLRQVHFMTDTMHDFQDFFRPSPEYIDFDVNGAIQSVLDILKGPLMKSLVTVNFASQEPLWAQGYPSEFKQVILNIINNARDVLVERKVAAPHITIEVRDDDGAISIFIADNGGGIPEDLLPEKIFEPFFTTKSALGGTGIGLSLARQIMEKMSGNIQARNVESGAQFQVNLRAHPSNS
ncbi:response regulator [Desulfurispira natronophila]|uniref:histidine kinase n=1 Tax=Desulfurispira natronophila TaxID=682562 RepID=A0A7W7Y422_9BACT|nr:response regulator [Desulfurispira natronophila]MBB5021549.1 C4-dicarboxylate-specific signal transduction histidine kinase [Desulfurispira natronophila]